MGNIKTWIDWAVLALCVIAALGVVFFGINALESTAWARASQPHAAMAVLAIIAALAVVNCSCLVGAAVCKARRDVRLGRR
jgi:hypothetical protein